MLSMALTSRRTILMNIYFEMEFIHILYIFNTPTLSTEWYSFWVYVLATLVSKNNCQRICYVVSKKDKDLLCIVWCWRSFFMWSLDILSFNWCYLIPLVEKYRFINSVASVRYIFCLVAWETPTNIFIMGIMVPRWWDIV